MRNLKSFSALFISAIIYGSFSIFIRLLNHDLTGFQQIAFRNAIGFLFAIIIVLVFRSRWDLKKVSKLKLLGYAFSFPIDVILFTFAVLQTSIAAAIFGLYIGTLLSSLVIGTFVFREPLTKVKIVSMAIVIIGLFFFTFPFSKSSINIGFLFAILSGIFDAIASGFKKYVAAKVDKFVLVAIQMLAGVILASFLIFINQQSFLPHITTSTIGIGLAFGALLFCIYYFTLIGFQNFDLNLGTIILASELFWGPLFAYIIFNESLTFNQMLGGIFIGLAIIIPQLKFNKSK